MSSLALLAGCVYAVLYCASGTDLSGHTLGSDDAYISFRYAQNLFSGHGLVFNVGDRVEGYTNLLYVLLMTVPFAAGWDVLSFSQIANTLFAMVGLTLFVLHIRRTLGEYQAVLAGVLFALSPSIWIWVSSGLETPLVFLLQLAIWIIVERVEDAPNSRLTAWLCLCIALLTLVRADGFVLPVLAITYLFVKGRHSVAKPALMALALTVTALFSWRWSYYHEIWPNTYYAKVSSPLFVRLTASLRQLVGIGARQGLAPYFVAIVVAAAMCVRLATSEPKAAWKFLRFDLCFAAGWIGYWLYVGGDIFEDRFLIVLIPVGINLLLRTILATASAQALAFVCLLGLIVQLSVPIRSDQYGKSMEAKYDRWVLLGQYLGEHHRGQILAVDAAGKIPFFSGLTSIDMLGLTDRHIGHMPPHEYKAGLAWVGHSKYDPDYVLSRRPDLVSAWVDDRLDLSFGLDRKKYEQAGYRIRYVVNARSKSRGDQNILDVLDRRDDDITSLVRDGYNYGVLELVTPRATSK